MDFLTPLTLKFQNPTRKCPKKTCHRGLFWTGQCCLMFRGKSLSWLTKTPLHVFSPSTEVSWQSPLPGSQKALFGVQQTAYSLDAVYWITYALLLDIIYKAREIIEKTELHLSIYLSMFTQLMLHCFIDKQIMLQWDHHKVSYGLLHKWAN